MTSNETSISTGATRYALVMLTASRIFPTLPLPDRAARRTSD